MFEVFVKSVWTTALTVAAAATMLAIAQERRGLPALVDEYLDQFARRHPSIAAGNGLHGHDDALEDFSAGAIASEVTWLRAYRSRLDALDPAPLSGDERVDRRILLGIVDGWLLDLDTVRTWTRNPMVYAAAISDGVHNLMTMESSPAPARMTQVVAKLPDAALQQALAAEAGSARRAIDAYARELETAGLQSATGGYAIGTANVEAR